MYFLLSDFILAFTIIFWDTENIIRARRNPNNSNELLGSEGEVLLYAGDGYYQLLYETREYEYYRID